MASQNLLKEDPSNFQARRELSILLVNNGFNEEAEVNLEYLCKYFGFRYAYCKLNIVYRKWMKVLVNILYTHKEKLKNKKGKLFHLINGVLQMEEIARSFKEEG